MSTMSGSTNKRGAGARRVTLMLAIVLCFGICTATFVSFSFHRSQMDTPSVGRMPGGPSIALRAFGIHDHDNYLFGTASLQGDPDHAHALLDGFGPGSRLNHFNSRYFHVTYNHGTRLAFISRQHLLDACIVGGAATWLVCTTFIIARYRIREKRRERLLCVQCAYPLRCAIDRCPECGTAFTPPYQFDREPPAVSLPTLPR
jgi:hypothetical protein